MFRSELTMEEPTPAAAPHEPEHPAASAGRGGSGVKHSPEEETELARIKELPREVGAMLITVGVLGMILPGLVGTPAVIAGGLVIWPRAFGKIETWFERRFPTTHRQGLFQINRYLNDLESRYPNQRELG